MKRTILLLYILVGIIVASCKNEHPTDTQTLHSGELCYRGEVKKGKANGYGVLTLGDSTLYSGTWKDGKRSGYGTTTDSLGRCIEAVWQSDTIMTAVRHEQEGTYEGELDTTLHAAGHGTWKGNDGTYYTGHWTNDKPNGFGCAVARSGRVKAGDWLDAKYRGEKMRHTSDRIYGIDLSKHQHEKGKKHYAINWESLRIIGLGSGNKGSGKVDYPISFVYIKATEGATVKNKYFHADYRQARAHGIKAGAYHFFSPSSTATAQARFFLKNSNYKNGDLPPVLDLEPSEEQIKQMGGAAEMFNRVRTWLNIVHNATGRRPVLYVGQGFVNKYLPKAPDIKKKYPVWIARYGQYRPDVKLAFWQLTPYGSVRGIHGDVDINVFNGYKASFNDFLNGNLSE